ncbi:DNA methylase [Actinokineospora sp. NPDC004072]
MTVPRVLDLFCHEGGATKGYQAAGFHVTGVDIRPQPNYVGEVFHEGDALEFLAAHAAEFDLIHASPPCQRYCRVTGWRGDRSTHPDLLGPTRAALLASGHPVWVIENVPEAPLRADFLLCGSMFGLRVRRHRVFETSGWGLQLTNPCRHVGLLAFEHRDERAYADAMGCHWMSAKSAREAIPPAYTRYLGCLALDHLPHPERRTA